MRAGSPAIGRLLCAACLIALFGCQAPEPWTKPGATDAELRRDLADCEREATGPGPFHFEALNETYEAARDRIAEAKSACMKARGWKPSA